MGCFKRQILVNKNQTEIFLDLKFVDVICVFFRQFSCGRNMFLPQKIELNKEFSYFHGYFFCEPKILNQMLNICVPEGER